MGLFRRKQESEVGELEAEEPSSAEAESQAGLDVEDPASEESAPVSDPTPSRSAIRPVLQRPQQQQQQKKQPPPRHSPSGLSYGIDKAIQLMRTLPKGDVNVIVQVVKATLESNDVPVKTIIDDGTRRQEELRSKVDARLAEIAEIESKIARLRHEIEEFEAQHAEVTLVKERLVLAEELSKKQRRTPSGRIVLPDEPEVVESAAAAAAAQADPTGNAPVVGQRRKPRD